MSNQQRNQSGSGIGSGVSDEDIKSVGLKDLLRQQEEPDHAPEILPYQLQNITDRFGDLFVNVLELKSQINSFRNHPGSIKPQIKKIDEINNKLDNINKQITDIVNSDLEVFKLTSEEQDLE